MKIARPHLTVLLNALAETGTTTVPVSHPSDDVGTLIEITLDAADASAVDMTLDTEAYQDVRNAVDVDHGPPAVTELPGARSYTNAFFAGGLLPPANASAIEEFVEANGHPDLSAGHQPVVAGFDTNLRAWRIADVLELVPERDGVVNGFVVVTGVRDELDWDQKRSNTGPVESAFGPEFEELWNQPAGPQREGRLGETYYRKLRDHRYADEVASEREDDSIVGAIDEYQRENRKTVLLFSNDRDFVERARAHRIRAQRVEFPDRLPGSLTGSWAQIRDTLYVLTVLFGVLELPKVTLYGVWKGKGGQDWHDEHLTCDCRSPKVEGILERDLAIIEAFEEATTD